MRFSPGGAISSFVDRRTGRELCAGLPLAVFYFFAREMPYDRVPKGWAERVGDGEEASEIPEASRA